MKKLVIDVCSILGVFLPLLLVFCEKNDDKLPDNRRCNSIEIFDENQGSTFLEFDSQSRLIKYDGYDLTSFYVNKWVDVDNPPFQFFINQEDDNQSPGIFFEYRDNEGNGFDESYFFAKGTNPNIVGTVVLRGFESNTVVTKTNKTLIYQNEEDCVKEYWTLFIDDEQVQTFEFENLFTDKTNPFWNTPFQVISGRGWDVGGFTNKHLPQIQNYTGKSLNLEFHTVTIEGTVLYRYQYDSEGRLSKISINKVEITTVTDKSDGSVSKTTNESDRVISLHYKC